MIHWGRYGISIEKRGQKVRKTSSIRTLNQRFAFGMAAVMLALTAAVVPMLVAAQAAPTDRSIEISSSSASATGVQYILRFKPTVAAQAFVLEFCDNTPLIGQLCGDAGTPPAGFVSNTASITGGAISSTGRTANKMIVTPTSAMASGVETEVTLTGVTNPTNTGQLYARIITYDTTEHAEAYASTNLGDGALDRGSVAIAITPTIGVSGTVLETLTFCVSGATIDADCDTDPLAPPVLRLGTETAPGSDIFAMQPGSLNEGNIYTQLTTNAASGAIVRLKSSASCGGLGRAGTSPLECDIAAAGTAGLNASDNSARFGVMTAASTAANGAVNATGILQPRDSTIYATANHLTYAFNYSSANPTTVGVTSTLGDPFLDTNNAPASNQNVTLKFGATVGNDTPAGTYSTDISLIAVGKF